MSTTLTASRTDNDDLTCTGARRRNDASLAGQLNTEWGRLCGDPATAATVRDWVAQHVVLIGCTSLTDIERAVVTSTSERTDQILLALLRLTHAGDALAGRTVLQLMLGKAIRIATARGGRDAKYTLEHTAIAALWTTIATYPTDRRPAKVAANIAMETLRAVTGELTHQHTETPTSPETLSATVTTHPPASDANADLELLNLLIWAVDQNTITAADATLILDIYTPAPGESGGAAAAVRHGLTWPAARQRASRAVRKIARAIHADAPSVLV